MDDTAFSENLNFLQWLAILGDYENALQSTACLSNGGRRYCNHKKLIGIINIIIIATL